MSEVQTRVPAWRRYEANGHVVEVRRLFQKPGKTLQEIIQEGIDRGYAYCTHEVAGRLMGDTSSQAGYVLVPLESGLIEVLLIWGTGLITQSRVSPDTVLKGGKWSVIMIQPIQLSAMAAAES